LASRPASQGLFYAFRPGRCNLQPAIPYSWQVSRIRTGRLIDKPKRRFQYENHNEIQYLPEDGADSGGACHPGGGTATSTLGTFQGKDAVNPPTITTSGGGTGTHLGEFSFTHVTTLNSPTTGAGSAHWVAANGDSIDSKSVVSADFSTHALGYITVTEIHTITGGTGRFAGAQGNFVLERTHIVAPSADGTHVTFGSFHGTITPPGAAH
jgi:hypothetical protein